MTLPALGAQAAMFLASQDPRTETGYSVPTMLELPADVGVDQVIAACELLAASTSALRARFTIAGRKGGIVQHVPRASPEMVLIEEAVPDWQAAQLLADRLATVPFDVDNGPLCRFYITRSDGHIYVIIVMHHLIVDGASYRSVAQRLLRALEVGNVADDASDYERLMHAVHAEEQSAIIADKSYWTDRLGDLAPAARWAVAPVGGLAQEGRRIGAVPLQTLMALRAENGNPPTAFDKIVASVHRALPLVQPTPTVVCAATSTRPRPISATPTVGCVISEVPLRADPGPPLPSDLATDCSVGWRADLRRRHFPFFAHARGVLSDGSLGPGLDSVLVSYRKTPLIEKARLGEHTCRIDLYPRYPAAKCEISVRFFESESGLEYEVQWGRRLPAGLGVVFFDRLTAVLESIGDRDLG